MSKITVQVELEKIQKAIAQARELRKELSGIARASGGAGAGTGAPPIMASGGASPKAPRKDSGSLFLNPLGLPGKLGEAFTAVAKLGIAFIVLRPIIEALGAAIRRVTKAMADGAELYTKAAQLGRNPADLFRARVGAKAAGMSPEQVQDILMKIGSGKFNSKDQGNFSKNAMLRGLGKEFEEVVKSIGQNQFKIIEESAGKFKNVELAAIKMNAQLDIFMMLLGEQLTGSVRHLGDTIQKLLKDLNESGAVTFVGRLLGESFRNIVKTFEAAILPIRQLAHAMEFLKGVFQNMVSLMIDLAGKLVPASRALLPNVEKVNLADIAAKSNKMWAEFFSKGLNPEDPGRTGNRNPPLAAPILPAGHWEKLGLSLGGGGAGDAAERTARNTEKMANLMLKFLPHNMVMRPWDQTTNAP